MEGYAGFNELYRSGGISEVACLAHIRRKFTDIFQAEALPVFDDLEAWPHAQLPRISGKSERAKAIRDPPPA